MNKPQFQSDYTEGALPEVMEALVRTNGAQTPGYGEDEFCHEAAELLKARCQSTEAAVHFLVGGTQTNLIAILACLRPYQGVISADSGHINTHETGAIEATGHKVLALPAQNGKITARQVLNCYEAHWGEATHEHTVQPGMVYISQPTEFGTCYTREELLALSQVCHRYGLPLFMDGARLAYALGRPENELTLADYAHLTDLFYFGGTKAGALFGEALVLVNRSLQTDFRYLIKQRGGLLAKGRLLGVQFGAMLENDCYLKYARHADELAARLSAAFAEKNCPLAYPTDCNMVFPMLTAGQIDALAEYFDFELWGGYEEGRRLTRFCCSWATTEENINRLLAAIAALNGER